MIRWSAIVAMLVMLVEAAPDAKAQSSEPMEVTVGYQLIYNPWKVAIHDRAFEKATGYSIQWKQFDSGASVVEAMEAGDVQIAVAGSSPIASAASRGVPIELFWIAEDIAAAEALVVREGSGIQAPQDLRGKRLAAPFVSTSHFHALFALEQFGIAPNQLELVDMEPPNIAGAWSRGEIDAAFVWEPALGEIKRSGKVLVTSGTLTRWGRATFDGMIVRKDFSEAHADFMCSFVQVLDEANAAFREAPENFGAGSNNARKIASLIDGDDRKALPALSLYEFPTLEEQVTERWLGGGAQGGAAQALRFTSDFLLLQEEVPDTLDDYSPAVNDTHARAALNGC